MNFHPTEDASATADVYIPLIFTMVDISSVLDLGCNVGVWLKAAIDNGVQDVIGVDGDNMIEHLRFPKENFKVHDLTKPLDVGRRFSLTICVEVAEHLDAEYSDILVETATKHADVVFWSAATPGQTGYNHINEQPHAYWVEKFALKGFVGENLSSILPVAAHDYYRKNAWLFRKT